MRRPNYRESEFFHYRESDVVQGNQNFVGEVHQQRDLFRRAVDETAMTRGFLPSCGRERAFIKKSAASGALTSKN